MTENYATIDSKEKTSFCRHFVCPEVAVLNAFIQVSDTFYLGQKLQKKLASTRAFFTQVLLRR